MIQVAIFSRASARVRNWRRWTYSTLMVEKVASATALSKHYPANDLPAFRA
ncbi:hypothetical protein [Dactylosporangium darangshiense]|uniref:hypothetical protein n=1 Tax=Dactylosporangium darangshiense TaxID=579108 RepID=UPI0031F17F3B